MWWMLVASALASDWALVRAGADLFAHAGDARPVVAVPALEDYLFEVVAQRDGWVGLRPHQPSHAACVPGHFPATRADITLWTPATSLLRVATRAAHAEPEPGVSLDVWPGWAPGRDPIDVWAISKLPQDLFGTTFVIPDGAAANRGGVPVGDWHGQVRIGGGLFVLPMPRVVSAERGDPPKIWMDDRCFSVTAPTAFPIPGYSNHAFPEGVDDFSSGPYGLLGLRAGATLRWPDDTEAGRVLGELMLEEPASVGELTCGNWSLWWNRTPSVRVCVSTSDLGRVAFWTTDPHTAVEWSRIGGVSSVRRSVMADALVALDRAVAACLSDVAPRSAFEVSFTLKDGVAPTAAVKSVPPDDPVPACLAPVMQKIVLPPKSSGRPKVSLRWNG